jgi:hypothetical protein
MRGPDDEGAWSGNGARTGDTEAKFADSELGGST